MKRTPATIVLALVVSDQQPNKTYKTSLDVHSRGLGQGTGLGARRDSAIVEFAQKRDGPDPYPRRRAGKSSVRTSRWNHGPGIQP
jgi:hypothetical protein